jgi:flagellar basal body-associated protein FliL
MKQIAINGALYGLPGLIVLILFFSGHGTISPQEDILDKRNPAPVEEEIKPEEEPEPEQAEVIEGQEPGIIMKPSFHYYPFPSTIMGNVPGTNQLFSFEIAVSIFETSLNASSLMKTLEEREPQLRPIILEQATDLDADTLLSSEGRDLLREKIKTQINLHLQKWGHEPFITSVEFTSFLIT